MKMPQLRIAKADIGWLLVAGLTVVLQFWWLPGDGGNVADSFSNSMEGSRGLFETLSVLSREGFLPPVRREANLLVPKTPCALLLLGPDRYPDEHEQEQLRRFVNGGGTVLFAANWILPNHAQPEFRSKAFGYRLTYRIPNLYRASQLGAAPSGGNSIPATSPTQGANPADKETPVMAESPDSEDTSTIVATENSSAAVSTAALIPPFALPELRTTSPLMDGNVPWSSTAIVTSVPRNAEKLVVDALGDTQVAAWPLGQGSFVVCATADPFSNRSMLFARQAEFAVRLVEYVCAPTAGRPGQKEIVVSEYLNGAGSYTGASVMVSPLLRSGTLQFILVAVLVAWAGFHRFGPPLRERREWRRSLADSATAVGNLQFMANDGNTSVRQYFEWFSGELRRRHGHSQILNDPGQLARQTGLDQEQIVEALADVQLRSQQKSVAPSEAAVAIRRLARIHQKLFASSVAATSDR